jgi:hypothetical protein
VPTKDLDLEILFQRFEKPFNLPPILVDGCNGADPQGVMIGQEHQDLSSILSNGFNAE